MQQMVDKPGLPTRKPPRPFGVTLAIVLSVVLYTVLPLLQVLLLLSIRSRFSGAAVPGMSGDGALAAGANFVGLDDAGLVLQVVFGLMLLVLALLAWRGQPRAGRWLFIGAVVGLAAWSGGAALLNILRPADVSAGLDSGRDVERGLLLVRTAFSVLVALYVVWYLNRAPARAFYRGYYLPAPEETTHS
jgi:hypothetical protein